MRWHHFAYIMYIVVFKGALKNVKHLASASGGPLYTTPHVTPAMAMVDLSLTTTSNDTCEINSPSLSAGSFLSAPYASTHAYLYMRPHLSLQLLLGDS